MSKLSRLDSKVTVVSQPSVPGPGNIARGFLLQVTQSLSDFYYPTFQHVSFSSESFLMVAHHSLLMASLLGINISALLVIVRLTILEVSHLPARDWEFSSVLRGGV